MRARRATTADFERFYREHVGPVYQYALAVLANPSDAEDVTQQTFLNAYRAFERGERPRKPHNWLIKIAHNVCRMRWRQAARRPQELPLEEVREPVAADDDRPSLDEVLAALAQLPFNQRAALVMRELEDRSYAEIADVLGTSVSAVEALLFRARTNLRGGRKTLGALTLIPLPGSLSSFVGGGSGGAVAAGGTAVGIEVALKVAAVVATGVVVGGLGYKSVDAIATPESTVAAALQRDHQAPLIWSSPLTRLAYADAGNASDPSGASPAAWLGDGSPRGRQAKAGHAPADEGIAAEAAGEQAPAAAAVAAGSAPAAAGATEGVTSAAGSAQATATQITGGTTDQITSVLTNPPAAPLPPPPAPTPPPVAVPVEPAPLPVALPTVPVAVPTVPTVPSVSVSTPSVK